MSTCLSVVVWFYSGRDTAVPGMLPDLYEASVTELQMGLDGGRFTSVDLVKVGTIVWQTREKYQDDAGVHYTNRRGQLEGAYSSRSTRN